MFSYFCGVECRNFESVDVTGDLAGFFFVSLLMFFDSELKFRNFCMKAYTWLVDDGGSGRRVLLTSTPLSFCETKKQLKDVSPFYYW